MTKKQAKKRIKEIRRLIEDVSEGQFRVLCIETALLQSYINGWDARKRKEKESE